MLLRDAAGLYDYGCNVCGDPEDDGPIYSEEEQAKLHAAATHLEALEAVMQTMPMERAPDFDYRSDCAAFVDRLRAYHRSNPGA